MTPVAVPMIANLGPTEIILIILVLVLLFGAKKLPELARGSGRALRIFKAETKGLMDDDDDGVRDSEKTEAQRQLDAQRRAEAAQRLETPVQQPLDQPLDRPLDQPLDQHRSEPRPDTER
jgi:sec-independent protein translocase protein TatA